MNSGVFLAFVVAMATGAQAVGTGGECDATSDCTTTNTQSSCYRQYDTVSCSKGQCVCNSGYSGNTCAQTVVKKQHGEACTQNSDCDTDLTCSNSACACATSTYTYRSVISMCLAPASKAYQEACTSNAECYNAPGASGGMVCTASKCECATGYVPMSGYCFLPYYGQTCETSSGCTARGLPWGTDGSRQTESCISGTCSCPSSSTPHSVSMGSMTYTFCLTNTQATLKAAGVTCSLHNECASHICSACPGDSTNTKRCLQYASGSTSVQAYFGVLLALLTLRVTLL